MKTLLCALAILVPFCEGVYYNSLPNSRDCFEVDAEDGTIAASYESFQGIGRVRVTMEYMGATPAEPIEALEDRRGKAEGLDESIEEAQTFQVPVSKPGRYALCLRNLTSQDQTITFDIRVQKDSDETHPHEIATNNDAENLKRVALTITEKVKDIEAQQNHSMTREGIHKITAESTNSRILFWTCFQALVTVAMAVTQVLYMRSFFEVKTLV